MGNSNKLNLSLRIFPLRAPGRPCPRPAQPSEAEQPLAAGTLAGQTGPSVLIGTQVSGSADLVGLTASEHVGAGSMEIAAPCEGLRGASHWG